MKNYFSGRVGRLDVIIWVIITLLAFFAFTLIFSGQLNNVQPLMFIFVILMGVFSISVWIRRWHDIGKSGFMVLTHLIPAIGPFFALYALIKSGDKGENKYGKVPDKKGRLREIFKVY